MGIYMHLLVSGAVTPNEWQAAYQETLKLVQAFSLGELREKEVAGVPVYCLTPTEERTQPAAWRKNGAWTGWTANGDRLTLRTAEEYCLPRDLENELAYDPSGGDAALAHAVDALFRKEDTIKAPAARHLWGGKTQGEPYHIALLAIGCLLADRLGCKVYVHGDITLGQCRRAVELANQVLDTPISLPDFCDCQRWYQRVQAWPLTEAKKVEAFERMYLGEKGGEFGAFLHENFSEAACRAYWQTRFRSSGLTTISFEKSVQQYLLWGFDLRELCELAAYAAKEGETYGEPLIRAVMDTGVYLTAKDCSDALEIDPQSETPYGVGNLLMQFVFSAVRNKYVDRYIPLEQVREALAAGLNGVCDANAVIDRYLKDKENRQQPQPAEALRTSFLARRDAWRKDAAQYDIAQCEQLLDYRAGDQIHPLVMGKLKQFRPFFQSLPKEPKFHDLVGQSARQRCRWLADNNRQLLLRDSDWQQIFAQIEVSPAAFARYYPMDRLQLQNDDAIEIMRGLVLNDALYAFFQTLPEEGSG